MIILLYLHGSLYAIMFIKNKIQILAAPENIWDFITDPAIMMSWNPRIKAVVPVTLGKLRANSQYRIRYELGSRENNYFAEIMEYEECSRIVLHFEGGGLPKKGYIQEIYELTPNSKGTLLMQSILVEQAGCGIPAQLVIRLGNLIGKSSGKKYLSQLKHLAEARG